MLAKLYMCVHVCMGVSIIYIYIYIIDVSEISEFCTTNEETINFVML
jgi:hypothetical protein